MLCFLGGKANETVKKIRFADGSVIFFIFRQFALAKLASFGHSSDLSKEGA
jgi:hypothetical protein